MHPAYLVPVTVVVGGDVDTVAVHRNNHGVLAGVRLTAGGRHQLIMRADCKYLILLHSSVSISMFVERIESSL